MGVAAALLGGLALYVFFGDETKPNPKGVLLETFQALKINENDIIQFGNRQRRRENRLQSATRRPLADRATHSSHGPIATKFRRSFTKSSKRRRVEKGADLTSNLATHGLDKPAVKVTLIKGDRSAWLALGKTTIGGDEAVVYVLTSDEPTKPQATRLKYLKNLFKEKPAGKRGHRRAGSRSERLPHQETPWRRNGVRIRPDPTAQRQAEREIGEGRAHGVDRPQ